MSDEYDAVLAAHPGRDGTTHWDGCHLAGRGHEACAVVWLVGRLRADRPADDGEPLTPEWVATASRTVAADGTQTVVFRADGTAALETEPNIFWVLPGRYTTRGHARRLLAALNIPLAEGR